ncbi:COG1470 family protein [Agromyces silvae]|uniref:COG1470 family protein n=1 Tax=Agromyces silvae TaxID=3388266 RepID=UPI00280B0343|nr:hypothetical protein [Agromyces protaetiae]
MNLVLAFAAAVSLTFPAGVPLSSEEPQTASITWAVTPASAAGPDGRSWVEHELDPGETITEHLAVRNLSTVAAEFRLSAADGYFTRTGRFNMLPSGHPSEAAGTWLDVQGSVRVEPGDVAVIPYTLTVPENATPGDHAAGIAASIRSERAGGSGTIGVESRVGFRVITRVAGELRPGMAIDAVTTSYAHSWNPLAPGTLTIGYIATNTGNAQLAYEDQINAGERTRRGDLLPGETRTVEIEQAAWPLIVVPVDLELSATAPGSEDGAVAVKETILVWAIPWPQLAVLAGVALLVVAGIAGRRRSQTRLQERLDEARERGRREALG